MPDVLNNKARIFLNGHYPSEQIKFYHDEMKAGDSLLIAVDGGLGIFKQTGMKPDIIIGDFDSIDNSLKAEYMGHKFIEIPAENKMFTDCEFALKYCREKKVGKIVIYGGIDTSFETDHLLGNVFLLFAYKKQFESIIMRDYCQEIIPLENETYQGTGKPGDFISIVPISDEIKFESTGLKYDSGGQAFKFGATTPLRNELSENEFKIELTGRALLVVHF